MAAQHAQFREAGRLVDPAKMPVQRALLRENRRAVKSAAYVPMSVQHVLVWALGWQVAAVAYVVMVIVMGVVHALALRRS